jgi:hypothetical protein
VVAGEVFQYDQVLRFRFVKARDYFGDSWGEIMANFDWKLWQTLIENYGKLWREIMANFGGKLWQTLMGNYGKL